jgi:hypothetical protein
MWCLNTFTWNHTVATFVKAAPDLHHYSRHNWRTYPVSRISGARPSCDFKPNYRKIGQFIKLFAVS